MKLDLYQGTLVILDLEHIGQAGRKDLLHSIRPWIADNVKGRLDTIFVHQGILITHECIRNDSTVGDTSYEKWIWIFKDPREATLFKMRWA